MTIMTTHSSATAREQEPHVNQTINQTTRTATIIDALKRRAQAILNDKSIDAQSRAVIRYALEINDPWLAQLVRRVDEGGTIRETDFSEISAAAEVDSIEEKIAALTEMICRAGDEA